MAVVKKMTERRLNRLLGLVQEADTPEQRDKAWDEIVAAFDFQKTSEKPGLLGSPLVAQLCEGLKSRLEGVGYEFDSAEVDRWFAEYDRRDDDNVDFWSRFVGPMLDELEDAIKAELELAETSFEITDRMLASDEQ